MRLWRPVLRYFGGKWKIAPWILEHFPPHRIYVETFGGAASVLMRKQRVYLEVYNDLDQEIVNVFRVMRTARDAEKLERLLRMTPYSRDEFLLSLVRVTDPVERARRTIVRSFQGFGSSGIFKGNTGFRAHDNRLMGSAACRQWQHYPRLLATFTERMQGVVIENKPALEVIEQQDTEDTLFYVDPPYVAETRRSGQYRHEMSVDDHVELAGVLSKVIGMVVISGYPSELYEDLYEGWVRVEKETTANGYRGGSPRTEVLWLSPRVMEQRLPLFREMERNGIVEQD